MRHALSLRCATFGIVGALLPAFAAQAAALTTLTIFATGTLAVPFRQIDALFEKKYPTVTVQAPYGGSVMMASKITDLHQDADLLAVADYQLIPKYVFGTPAHASWYVGFARNAITLAYTDKSKYSKELTSQNWYKILARPSVEIRRSNTDADLSGYQTVQMLNRAGKYYSAGKHAAVAEKYVAMLLGPQGQAVMKNNGFEPVSPAYPVHAEAIPAAPKTLVEPWPGL